MPTRIISWQQLVLENDPDWIRNSLNPVVWEFSNGRRFVDPAQVYAPLPDSGLLNDGGFLVLDGAVTNGRIVDPGVPGTLFSQNGFICVSGGVTNYQPGLHLFFPGCTLDQLFLIGGNACPNVSPSTGSSQIWNNGGFICVA